MKLRGFNLVCTIIFSIVFLFVISIKMNKDKIEAPVSGQINFDVSAESCIVYDPDEKEILYQNNIHKKLLPASITKILTCITALEVYPLDDYVYITNDIANTVGSKIYLKPGDYIKIEDLLYGLMLCSGNDAAVAISTHLSGEEEDFIFMMNKICDKVGMKNSSFYNSSGLDEKTLNYTTAYDMALLTSYAINNSSFLKIFGCTKHIVELPDRKLYFNHKHKLVKYYDYAIGGKTGYTEKAGRTLVTLFEKDDQRIIVVTFNSHNDWNIHLNFADYFLDKKRTFLDIYITSFISIPHKIPFLERLKVGLDD